MKAVMLMVLLGLPAVAVAREATDVEDAWAKLQLLAHGATADALSHAKAHGLGLTDMVALQRYVEESREKLGGLSRDFWNDLFANCAEYESDHEKLIQRWELYVQDKESMRQSIIDDLPEVIGKANADAFSDFVVHSKKTITAGFDATDMRSNEFMRQRMLDKACKRGDQP